MVDGADMCAARSRRRGGGVVLVWGGKVLAERWQGSSEGEEDVAADESASAIK